ncbi:hypothetical protein PEDI_17370 [Persicobacter diffluens]|uniref:Uncharacterized protein n=1 Tax=Persicobacter diffluens TaxID=981 RepID=A0AAN4VYK5_9BACT|nr:hypothetical protein PEDI_17370 [Persicobacter diffluens]
MTYPMKLVYRIDSLLGLIKLQSKAFFPLSHRLSMFHGIFFYMTLYDKSDIS